MTFPFLDANLRGFCLFCFKLFVVFFLAILICSSIFFLLVKIFRMRQSDLNRTSTSSVYRYFDFCVPIKIKEFVKEIANQETLVRSRKVPVAVANQSALYTKLI